MEFLELLLVLIALILIIKKPEKENLAFGLVMVAWLLMVFFLCWPQNRRTINNNESVRKG